MSSSSSARRVWRFFSSAVYFATFLDATKRSRVKRLNANVDGASPRLTLTPPPPKKKSDKEGLTETSANDVSVCVWSP